MDYTKAILIEPEYAKGYYNIGVTYQEMNEFDLAIAYYNKAINLNSKFAEAYCNRGVSKAKSGDFKGALSDLNESIDRKPEMTIAYFNKVNIRRKLFGENIGQNEEVLSKH